MNWDPITIQMGNILNKQISICELLFAFNFDSVY